VFSRNQGYVSFRMSGVHLRRCFRSLAVLITRKRLRNFVYGCKHLRPEVLTKVNSRCSSVSVVTRLRAGRSGFDFPQEQGCFSSPLRPDRFWDLPISFFSGDRGLLPPGVKQPGREAGHLLSSIMRGAILHFLVSLHVVVLSFARSSRHVMILG
jgi:hypothetical protein